MKTIESISELGGVPTGGVLSIGNFDGVHIGHQEILAVAKQAAAQRKSKLTVMTFEPHPLTVLHPPREIGTLTPLVLKKCLLAEFGVDCLFVLKSTAEILGLRAEEFVERFIIKGIQPSVIVEGEDFNFGHKRAGSVHTLQKLTEGKGIEVFVVDPQKANLAGGQAVEVSSTVIRDMVTKGKMADAAILLGRPYRLVGDIVPGRGKGKQLGFPTLNLGKPQQLVPAQGVYAGIAAVAGTFEEVCSTKDKIPAVFSIGQAATYGDSESLLIEAHLLVDNAERFNGRYMVMDFIERIRSQQKFETEKELAVQIAKDCEKAKCILENE